jgi:rhodanese-related sulfurtransferase
VNGKRTIWVLIGVLALALLALLLVPRGGVTVGSGAGGGAWPGSEQITNAQLKDFVARGARLVDVRTAGEYAAGHIQGAENVPVGDVPTTSGSWDKAAPVVVYCQTGARSLNAFEYLKAQGFSHVYDLTAGIVAWDGQTVQGTAAGSAGSSGTGAKGPATALPTMYDFASAT